MDRESRAKALMEEMLRNEYRDFFETYTTREEAVDAWKNVRHYFVALCIALGKTEDDLNEMLDDWFGEETA